MTKAFPFDIITQIALNADHNVLLGLRATSSEVKDFVTPLAFRSLRVACNSAGFERLYDFGVGAQKLCALVQHLEVVQSQEDRMNLLYQESLSSLDFVQPGLLILRNVLPNIVSMIIRFPEFDFDTAGVHPADARVQQLLCYGQEFPEFQYLRKLELINVTIGAPEHRCNWNSISSLAFTRPKHQLRYGRDRDFEFDIRPLAALRDILPKLSAGKLTSLRLGSTFRFTKVALPKEPHFLRLAYLELDGFKLDTPVNENTEDNIMGFIERHRTSLRNITLIDCSFDGTLQRRIVEEGVNEWMKKKEIPSVVQYRWSR